MFIFVLASFCSWEQSTQVKSFLKSDLYPLMSKHKISKESLPLSCPFRISDSEDTLLDIYSLFKRETVSYFECQKCNKQFRTETQIKDHISLKHGHNQGKCLGEFCEFIPCSSENILAEIRCEAIMTECFPSSRLQEFVNLCTYKEASMWDIEMKKPWMIIISILMAVFCLVYYLTLWAEMEEGKLSNYKKRKHKLH